MAASTATIVGYGLAALAAGVSAEAAGSAAHDAQVDFKKREDEAIKKNQELINEASAKQKKALDLEETIKKRDQSLSSQKVRQARTQGRQSTILTSPIGVISEPNTAPKTLLGA